jgi:hypothetical protein
MLEVLIFLGVSFFIAVLFYKQANESFEILQLDADRISDLPTLYSDHSPIVIKSFQTPLIGSFASLSKRTNIMNMLVAPSLTLKALLSSEGSLKAFTWKPLTAAFLSKESGLNTWFEHHLYPQLLPSPYTSFLYSQKSSLWIHHKGLCKTTAFQTLIMPTQGTVSVSLLLPKMIPYLPSNWQTRSFSSLSLLDTPLLNQIQFLEIKVRTGNLLLLPAHLLVDIKTDSESKETAWIFYAEVHHPISRIAG